MRPKPTRGGGGVACQERIDEAIFGLGHLEEPRVDNTRWVGIRPETYLNRVGYCTGSLTTRGPPREVDRSAVSGQGNRVNDGLDEVAGDGRPPAPHDSPFFSTEIGRRALRTRESEVPRLRRAAPTPVFSVVLRPISVPKKSTAASTDAGWETPAAASGARCGSRSRLADCPAWQALQTGFCGRHESVPRGRPCSGPVRSDISELVRPHSGRPGRRTCGGTGQDP